MAPITINRTPWNALIDDSGQNLDGSLWDKAAIKGVLLDPIDAALAQAAGLAIANVFTANQQINGTLGVSGLLTLGNGQIKFPVAQQASGDPNILDDYEEGTFTPSDASGDAITFATAQGLYVKIGSFVWAAINVLWPTNAGTRPPVIAGLPFTVAGQHAGAAIGYTTVGATHNILVTVNTNYVQFFLESGGQPTNGNYSGKQLNASFSYRTTG